MAGYWLIVMDRHEVSVQKKKKKNAKRERGQYPAILTQQAWSIKDLLYGQKTTPRQNFAFAGTKQVISCRKDRVILYGNPPGNKIVIPEVIIINLMHHAFGSLREHPVFSPLVCTRQTRGEKNGCSRRLCIVRPHIAFLTLYFSD